MDPNQQTGLNTSAGAQAVTGSTSSLYTLAGQGASVAAPNYSGSIAPGLGGPAGGSGSPVSVSVSGVPWKWVLGGAAVLLAIYLIRK
jgi:hypothetical protein